ncbi:hypothetical protein OAO87_04725 [bacterium]|nr:hypothetical protein [bacterium]
MNEAYARARRVVEALAANGARFVGDGSTLKTGIAQDTVRGLEYYMCVDEDVVRKGMLEGTAAIVREIEQLGEPELIKALHEYGLCETGGASLAALVADDRSVSAGLREHHVVAVRTYTSGAPGPARSHATRGCHRLLTSRHVTGIDRRRRSARLSPLQRADARCGR